MNRKGLIALGAIATIGKIIMAVAFASALARCSNDKPIQGHLEGENLSFNEFDYSLGKSAKQSSSTPNTASQSHNYGRNRK